MREGGISIKIIYFDTETTGLDFANCQIIELAMLIVEDGEIGVLIEIDEVPTLTNAFNCLSPTVRNGFKVRANSIW